MNFYINKESSTPIYEQLRQEIKNKISFGELSTGFRMPPERELSQRCSISRGTVKKVYDSLAGEGLLEIRHGSGTYVSRNKASQENLLSTLSNTIKSLIHEGYSAYEVEVLFHSIVQKITNKQDKIAVIECNSESISIINKQLQGMQLTIEHYLLDDVKRFTKGDDIFSGYKLIFTTTTHYDEICKLLPAARAENRIKRIVLSPDIETLMEISTISKDKQGELGIITNTRKYANLIESYLLANNLFMMPEDILVLDEEADKDSAFDAFILSKKYLITPPLYTLKIDEKINMDLMNFYKYGGRLLVFNYVIEKGSMLQMEEFVGQGY